MEVVVVRHPRERRSKCSLQPLVGHPSIAFHKAKEGFRFDASGYTLLSVEAPLLSRADAGRPLLLLDSTWRLLPALEQCLEGDPQRRSLPSVRTAYPRISKLSDDPDAGLASVEALYLACRILGFDTTGLLDAYYWREAFLENLAAAGLE